MDTVFLSSEDLVLSERYLRVRDCKRLHVYRLCCRDPPLQIRIENLTGSLAEWDSAPLHDDHFGTLGTISLSLRRFRINPQVFRRHDSDRSVLRELTRISMGWWAV